MELLLVLINHASPPIWAASNNHSPNKCKILLHLGLAVANGGFCSKPKEGRANGTQRIM